MRVARVAVVPTAVAACIAVAACGSSSNSSTTSASAAPSGTASANTAQPASGGTTASKGTLGFSVPVTGNPFFEGTLYAFDAAAKKLGYSVKALNANLSPDKQVSDLAALASLKVKAVVSWTLNPKAAQGPYQSLTNAGIPVVGMGSTSPSFKATIWPSTNPPSGCAPFALEAKYIAARAPGGKILLVLGGPVPSLQHENACMISTSKAAGLVIAEQAPNAQDNASAAQSIVQNMLTTHPDVSAIWGYNDNSALGAAAVVAGSGKSAWNDKTKKGVIIAGSGADPDAIDAIKAGKVTVTEDSNVNELGTLAAQLAAAAAQGKPVPKQIVIPTKLWDQSSVGSYLPPDQRPITLNPLPK